MSTCVCLCVCACAHVSWLTVIWEEWKYQRVYVLVLLENRLTDLSIFRKNVLGKEYGFPVTGQICWVRKTNWQPQGRWEYFLNSSPYIFNAFIIFQSSISYPLCHLISLPASLLSFIPHFHYTYSPFLLSTSLWLFPDYYCWLHLWNEKCYHRLGSQHYRAFIGKKPKG